jgi:hypothetical protein
MNEEKELLINKCVTNRVMSVIVARFSLLGEAGALVRIQVDDLARESGLSDLRIRQCILWLQKKGLVTSTLEGEYPQRGSLYALDKELWQAARELKVPAFGVLKSAMFDPFNTDDNRPSMMILSINGPEVGDEYGTPLRLDEARELRETLSRYIAYMEPRGDIALEKHRESKSNLNKWGGRYGLREFYDKPPALVCDCFECKTQYEEALRAWTNFTSYKKQEGKIIRTAMKELA